MPQKKRTLGPQHHRSRTKVIKILAANEARDARIPSGIFLGHVDGLVLPRGMILAWHGGVDTRADGDGKDVRAGHLGADNLQSGAGKRTQFGGLRKYARSDLPQNFPALQRRAR